MSKIYESFVRHELALKKYLGRFFVRREDVDDIAQETFLKAFASETRTEIYAPKAFLFKAAKHLALNELARKSYQTTDYTEDLGGPDVFQDSRGLGADSILDSKRKLLIFSKAVASLPPKCRKVFILRKVEGLKVKDIAKKLNITVSGVEKHVATGLIKCSQYFREHGYDPIEFGQSVRHTRQARKDLRQDNDD